MDKKNNNSDDMTLKEVQYLIKRIEKGTLDETKDDKIKQNKKENGQRLVLKLQKILFIIVSFLII